MDEKSKKLSEKEEELYKELLAKEIKSKLANKIDQNDPKVLKTIKFLLDQDKDEKK